MRSTRIRTFYNSIVTIPNNNLITAVIDNMGARYYRRFRTFVSVPLDTEPERIDAFCEGIRELIRRHPYTRKDLFHVYLHEFKTYSLDILLNVFFVCPDSAIEFRERGRLISDILRLAKELGVRFAVPTQTLFNGETPSDEPVPIGDDPITLGRSAAVKIYPIDE
jgi:MscS family membrane protein